MLIDVAFRAVMQRNRVAFFEVGDMTRAQISRRFAVRVCNHPWRPRIVKEPIRIGVDKTGPHVDFKEFEYKEHLQLKMLEKGFSKLRDTIKSSKTLFKLQIHPAASLSISHLTNTVKMWARDGWVPDVIVIDYADLLAQNFGKSDVREKINDVWIGLRALSQTMNCLVVTATQANRASYNVKAITMEHASEDKRKNAHVTGMVAINQTPEEKKYGVIRLGWVDLREDDYNPHKFVHVAGCLSLANPTMISCFERPPVKTV
jgi:replicative DNA helicase